MFRRLLRRQHSTTQGGGSSNPREYRLPKGKKLARRYEILGHLGEGGFGRTYIAKDLQRPGQPQCVVKHLQPVNTDPQFLQDVGRLFQQEAEVLEKLGDHDQIPRLLAYFRDGQDFYLVQEFFLGETLSTELIQGQPWHESSVYHLLQEVLKVLKFVHSQNVIHRDIKPDNLIRRQRDQKLVLIDFGAVKQVRGLQVVTQGHTTVTISVGTLVYMPPEQISGKPRRSSDIYALGIMAIQALTGLLPEDFKDDLDTDEGSWQQKAQVSQPIADIVTKMVRYRPMERYQSAVEVLIDLTGLTDNYQGSLLQSSNLPIAETVESEAPNEPQVLPKPPELNLNASKAAVISVESSELPSNESQAFLMVEQKPSEMPIVETQHVQPTQQPQVADSATKPTIQVEVQSLEIQTTPEADRSDSERKSTQASSLMSAPPTNAQQSFHPSSKTQFVNSSPSSTETLASQKTSSEQQLKPQSKILSAVSVVLARHFHHAVTPLQRKKTAVWLGVGVAVPILIWLILFAVRVPEPSSRSPQIKSVPTPEVTQLNKEKEILDNAVSLAKNGNLEQAIQKVQEIPENSPIHSKVKGKISSWQATILQDYFRFELPKKNPKLKNLIDDIKPVVKKFDADQIIISYDSSANADYSSETGLRIITALFMGRLRGNPKENISPYSKSLSFNRLIVYHQQSDKKAILESDAWEVTVKRKAKDDEILNEVQIGVR